MSERIPASHPGGFFMRMARTWFLSVRICIFSLLLAPAVALAVEASLQRAMTFFSAGQYDEARAEVESLRRKDPPDMQVLFLSGVLYYREAQYQAAADEFRKMLVRDPSLLRPRLELARTLYQMGEYDAAQYHFEQVLAADLPKTVRWNVLRFIRDIQDRLPTLDVALELTWDSNPKQATSSERIDIGGYPYQLNDDARARASSGWLLTADARIPYADEPTWYGRIRLNHAAYSDHALDWSYLNPVLGKSFPFRSHTLSLEAGGQAAFYGGEFLYRGRTLGVSERHRFSSRFDLEVSAWARERRYIDYRYLDGWVFDYTLKGLYAPDTASRWEMQLGWSDARLDDTLYAYHSPTASVRYVHEWSGGWITTVRLQYALVRFHRPDPLFNITRRDTERGVELNFINRSWSWQGFTPQLAYGAKMHDSNLELYTFERRYVRFGVAKTF